MAPEIETLDNKKEEVVAVVEEDVEMKDKDEVSEGEKGEESGKKAKRGSAKRGVRSPVTPTERPTRERKTVERYQESATRLLAPKPFSVEKGAGTPLKEIPNVAFKLSKRKPDDNLQSLHMILFNKRAKVNTLKKNIGLFSGFVWADDEEKQRTKLKEKLDRLTKEKLFDFCDILNLQILKSTVKEDVSLKLLEFLQSPHVTTEVLLAEKEQKGKKPKSSAKKSRTSSSTKKSGEKRKRSSKTKEESNVEEAEGLESESDESQEEDDKNTPLKAESDEEEDKSDEGGDEEDDKLEDEEEPEKEPTPEKPSSKKSAKKESVTKTAEKSKAVKKNDVKTPTKSNKKSSTLASKKAASNKKSEVEKSSKKVETKVSAKKDSAKEQAKGKPNKKAKAEPKKAEPTNEEMHAVVSSILKEVDFNTATLSDIIKQLGTHFGQDLLHRKGEVKGIITDVINNMSGDEDEEEEEKEVEAEAEAESGSDEDEDGENDS